ncbi:uncharacterized protein LOC134801044 [Cydia splendana]|uniref:uncharacterized protein LOC134801044 n=1 Tax=Cydia splendana TaxID=1100963 RepID=UPI00300C8146
MTYFQQCLRLSNYFFAIGVTQIRAAHCFELKNSPTEVKRDLEPKTHKETVHNHSAASEEPIDENYVEKEGDTFNEKQVHKALARAVYVTGQPLSIFEHPLWKQALQLLRANFNPPSRKMLSTVLLEEEYEDVKQKVTEKIEDANDLHIAADGWTNIRKDSILNIIIYTPKPYFHSSIDTQNNRHTAEYLSEKISQTMNEIGSEKFLGIVTDNAANMKKCGKLLTDQYEHTTWVGCLAHTLNLLIGDVLKIDSIQESFKSVSAEFKKIALEKSLNVTLLFPVKTRWGSYLHCLENFLKSKSILQTMVVNEDNRDLQKHKLKLLSETTWQDVANQITFLKPIVKWITILEGDSCSIHLVHRALEEIEEELESDNSKSIFEEFPLRDLKLKLKTRKENCVKPIHLAAVILDPKNQGATLNDDEYLDGCSTIMTIAQCDATLIQELSDYKCRKDSCKESSPENIPENILGKFSRALRISS